LSGLRQQLVPIAFREGIDTKTAPKASVPGRLMELENGVFTKVGEIRKRNGYAALSKQIENGGALTSADALATFRSELLCFGGGRVYSYADALEKWVDRGAAVSAKLTEQSVVRNAHAQSVPDVARSGGMTLTAWEDTRGGVRYSLTDDTTGAAYVADGAVSTSSGGTRPRVVVHVDCFYIFYSAGAGIFYRKVDPAAPTVIEIEQNPIATLHSTLQVWDVLSVSGRLYVSWIDTAIGAVAINFFNAAMALGATTYSVSGLGVTMWADAALNVWFLSADASNQYLTVYDPTFTALCSAVTVGSVASNRAFTGVAYGEDSSRIVVEDNGSVLYAATVHVTGAIRSAMTEIVRSVGLVGRAFEHNLTSYVPVCHASTLQSTLFVIDAAAGAVVGKAASGLAGGARERYTLSNVTEHAAGKFSFAATVKTALEGTSGGVFTRNGVEWAEMDFTGSPRFQSCELGANLIVAGACVSAYDGATYAEQGFHLFPEGIAAPTITPAAGALGGGAYQWRWVYEWTDLQGQVHRSAPSPAVSYVATANDSAAFVVPTLRLTGKSLVRIVGYRTAVNGSIFYRLGTIASPTLNDKTVNSVAFTDGASDASIAGNELLYSDGAAGSELENIAPGGASLMVSHRGRAFCKVGPQRVAYSKLVEDGRPVEFNDGLYIMPDTRGGEVSALASMDDKLIIFKDRAIFAINGDGPDFTGAGSYPEPVLVTSDVGCNEPRSVVLTGAGLLFKSAKGIYLLDRSLQVTYIGAPVEDYNGLTLTSATMVPGSNQVRWTSSGSVVIEDAPRTGVGLVYDYVFNQWGTFTNHDAVAATVWNGVYTLGKSDGRTWTEDSTTFADAGAWVRLKLTTSWLTFAGVQGFQRIYRVGVLGDYKSDHSLRIRLGYNYSAGFPYSQDLDAETLVGAGTWGSDATWGSGSLWGGADPVEWFCARPERQKCAAIRVSIEDVQTDTSGEGFSISNLALLVGVKRGPFKFTADRHT
jgi:hypothetical protein